MRVVVTGAAGFIGSHLCDALLRRGDEVVGIDCFTEHYGRDEKEANLRSARTRASFRLVELDLRSGDLLPVFDGADVVVHEAAAPGLGGWDRFDTFESGNVVTAAKVADAVLRAGVGHLVHASTSSVYGIEATGAEEADLAPVSPYGVTKLAAEQVLRARGSTDGLPFTILRYYSVYGPRQRPDMAYRIIIDRLLAGRPVTIYGDGRQSRSNTYVDDVVDATLRAVDAPPSGSTYNVGGGRELELLTAVELIAGLLGVEPVIESRPARGGDQRRTVAVTERIAEALGWQATVVPEVGLLRQVEWARGPRGLRPGRSG
mgnify:CR=1 FL=1